VVLVKYAIDLPSGEKLGALADLILRYCWMV